MENVLEESLPFFLVCQQNINNRLQREKNQKRTKKKPNFNFEWRAHFLSVAMEHY